jgi:hypothetical protein
MTADDEADRLQRLAGAVSAAVNHANALQSTFAALGSQLNATTASLNAVFAVMTPLEKAHLEQQLTAALGSELTEVIGRLEALGRLAGRKPLSANSGEGVPGRVN